MHSDSPGFGRTHYGIFFLLYSLVGDDGKVKTGVYMFDEEKPQQYSTEAGARLAGQVLVTTMKRFGYDLTFDVVKAV